MPKQQELTWDEVSTLIASEGSGEHIGARMRLWREARGWSLERLATEMNKAPLNAGMNASSLWKIENHGKGGRRSISIDEAITISRVFDKSLAEVLLPDNALLNVSGWQAVIEAAEALNRVRAAWDDYKSALLSAQSAVEQSPELRDRTERAHAQELEQFVASHKRTWKAHRVRMVENGYDMPADEEFEAYALAQETTPLIATLEDVLEDRLPTQDGWAIGRLVTPRTKHTEGDTNA
jgi:transcriptional regulator with XRE-family HTH domain